MISSINPYAGLTLSSNVLYGTTAYVGTVFKLNTGGTGFAVLKHFTADGERFPRADLTLSGTVLYGTTRMGGSSDFLSPRTRRVTRSER